MVDQDIHQSSWLCGASLEFEGPLVGCRKSITSINFEATKMIGSHTSSPPHAQNILLECFDLLEIKIIDESPPSHFNAP